MGVLSRALESVGLSTVGITLVREHTEKVKAPRALWVPYAFGRPLGKPDDPVLQQQIIRAALELFKAPSGPVLEDVPDDDETDDILSLPQSTDVQRAAQAPTDVAFEVTTLRPYYAQWLAAHDGRTAVGASGIDQRRFRGAIRFLEAYAGGEPADMDERPPDVSTEQFLRRIVDDLKAFYFEARMAQAPQASFQDQHAWFWSQTALGGLLTTIRDRLKLAGDPRLDQVAFGIAR